MFINLDLIRKLTHGAVSVTEKDGWFLFSRFTDEQREAYRNIPDFYRKTFASSGIRLEFKTSSSFFAVNYQITGASSRKFYYFDVFVNGLQFKQEGSESYETQPEGGIARSAAAGNQQDRRLFSLSDCCEAEAFAV